MNRKYSCLNENIFQFNDYKIVPLRDEDKYPIMEWRNEQIEILRQNAPLTKQSQENYFKTVVEPLFSQENPSQVLFSFLLNDNLIGYGGIVHINWKDKHGEISFLLETQRNTIEIFSQDIARFLELIKVVAFQELAFRKIFTYAYDIRPYLYPVLEKSGFYEEARLKDHVLIDGKFKDVLIHSCFNESLL